MVTTKQLEQLAWQSLWVSWFEDEWPIVEKHITQFPPASMIVFKRHLPDLTTAIACFSAIHAKTQGRTRISIDEEGGLVRRMPEGFPAFPAAESWHQQNIPATQHQVAVKKLGQALAFCGVAIDFSPVADLNFAPDHPALKTRCYHRDPAIVSDYAAAAIRGFGQAGISGCLKHFPGHGAVLLDSHDTLDTLTRSLQELRAQEWLPFRAGIEAGAALIMAAHFMWPEVDFVNPTATSPKVIAFLRQELNYQKMILTDDLEMGAIAQSWSPAEVAAEALAVGYNGVLFCKRFERAQEAAQAIIQKAEKSAKFRAQLEENAALLKQLPQVSAPVWTKNFSQQLETIVGGKSFVDQVVR